MTNLGSTVAVYIFIQIDRVLVFSRKNYSSRRVIEGGVSIIVYITTKFYIFTSENIPGTIILLNHPRNFNFSLEKNHPSAEKKPSKNQPNHPKPNKIQDGLAGFLDQ